MVDELLERFRGGEVAEVEEDLVPEAGVEEVEDSVFGAADVEVDGSGFAVTAEPVGFGFAADEAVGVVRVAVAEVVPAGAGPLGHGVGFALGGIGVADPVGGFDERAAGVAGGFEVFEVRLEEREFGIGDGAVFAVFPDDGEGFAPVALTGEEPVAEFELDAATAEVVRFEP